MRIRSRKSGLALTALTVLATSLTRPVSATPVLRCVDAQGNVVFTQFRCPASHPREQAYAPRLSPQYSAPPLTAEERKALSRFGQSSSGSARRATRRSADTQAQPSAADLCDAARAQLRALREERRKGYPLSQDARMQQRESAIKRQRRTYC